MHNMKRISQQPVRRAKCFACAAVGAAPTASGDGVVQLARGAQRTLTGIDNSLWRNNMPVILWLLGVPITVVILLMLFHVL